jgi:hypothetical protein
LRPRFSTPDVDERHFSTLNADKKSKFLTPDVDKKQRGDVEGGGSKLRMTSLRRPVGHSMTTKQGLKNSTYNALTGGRILLKRSKKSSKVWPSGLAP